ncbi:MAG TPA: Hint domain-containing protein, partial [Paracoccus sp. (in: a-proteobacteria)]|nr:Hint domain-containing protein [Paracoccus sp. (in: a-proteobacteria)]
MRYPIVHGGSAECCNKATRTYARSKNTWSFSDIPLLAPSTAATSVTNESLLSALQTDWPECALLLGAAFRDALFRQGHIMPIEDNSVDYFRAGSPIRIGTVSQGAETRLEVANLLLGARYDGPKTNTTLSDSGADKDQILRVGDSFSVKSAASPSQHIKLTLVGTGTYTTYPLLGAPVTRIVLIGETAAKQQYVVFPNADAPDLLGNLAATLNIRSAGYDFGTHEISNCYLPGTQILTDHGTVAVEELREGDMVVCRFGCLRPVRWIGWQRFAGRRAAGQEAIRFAPGSIADDMPRQPLFVSPGHSMLVGETLVLAADLVNGITITREAPREEWTYFQIDLGDHDMVLANGAWSESFADCGAFRSKFDNFADFRLR